MTGIVSTGSRTLTMALQDACLLVIETHNLGIAVKGFHKWTSKVTDLLASNWRDYPGLQGGPKASTQTLKGRERETEESIFISWAHVTCLLGGFQKHFHKVLV